MTDQPGGTMRASTAYHPTERKGLVALSLPGERSFYVPPEQAEAFALQIMQASVAARWDAAVFRVMEDNGRSLAEAEALLRAIGKDANIYEEES